jgi:uncharacterized coiled-coil protein SlyX
VRKPVQIGLIAAVLVFVGATAVLFVKYRQASADYANMKNSEESARARFAQSVQAIVEIQDSLSAIAVGDTAVRMLPGDSGGEQDLNNPDPSVALQRIGELRASISRTKDRIRQLESSLEKSGNRIAGLRNLVANLKKSVAEKEEQVAALSGRVDSLNTQVAGLQTTVEETQDQLQNSQQALDQTQHQLATVYYIVGSKKDLTQSGVVEAKGGLLGMGKTLLPSTNANNDLFTALDTDEDLTLRINAPKAKVLSAQPASSYELTPIEGGLELHITNPEEFRKIKQVIILTA